MKNSNDYNNPTGSGRGRGRGQRSGRGRGRGRRSGDVPRGFGRRGRVTRFLRPCLMLMLHREPSHGYQLLSGLDEFGLEPEMIDPSLIYRTLRDLENEQMVQSRWGTDSKGPRRRVYSITESGEEYLAHWINELQHTRTSIDSVLEAFDQLAPREDVEGNDRS